MPQSKPVMPKKGDCKTFLDTIEHDYKVQFKKYLGKPEFINCVIESHSMGILKFKNVTPLFWAIVHKKIEAVIVLLERGADSNAKVTQACMGREEMTTPLAFACCRFAESVEASKLELYYTMICNMLGKDANKATQVTGMPLLHFIYTQKNKFTPQQLKQLIELVIENNANNLLNQKNAKGKTLLDLAIVNNDLDFITLLLALGANPNATSTYSGPAEFAPLRIAAEHGFIQIATVLLDHSADIDQLSGPGGGGSALHIAANLGNLKLLTLLLDRKANIDLPGNQGVTAIYIATQYGHLSIVEELLRRGANLNGISSELNPLKMALALEKTDPKFSKIVELFKKHLAVIGGDQPSSSVNLNMVEWFISNYDRDKHTLSPLECLKKIWRILKSYDVNEIDSQCNTLLSVAVELRSEEMVAFLLNSGAKVSVGKCPVVLASSLGLTPIVDLLLTANKKEEKTCIDVLREGCSALNLAVQNNHFKTVEMLLAFGFNPHQKINGSNSLHVALKKGHYDIAEILIKSGSVDVNLPMEGGYSPLQIELIQSIQDHSTSNKSYELICLLIKYGANINIKNILLEDLLNYFPNQKTLPVVSAVDSTPDIFNLLCQKTEYRLLTSEDSTENPLFVISVLSRKVEMAEHYFNNILKADALRLLAIVIPFSRLVNSEMSNYFIEKQSEFSTIEQRPVVDQPLADTTACNEVVLPMRDLDVDPVAMSGRAYLKQFFKLEESEIDRLITENKARGKSSQQYSHRPHFFSQATSLINDPNRILSFAQGRFSISLASLEQIHGKENCWHFISEDLVSDQGCSSEQLEHFQSAQQFVSNGTSRGIKFLDQSSPNKLSVEINNVSLISTLCYELKIKHSPARILGFSLLGDDGKTTVYFACLYLSKGLHQLSDAKSLADRSRVIKFEVPDPTVASSSRASLS